MFGLSPGLLGRLNTVVWMTVAAGTCFCVPTSTWVHAYTSCPVPSSRGVGRFTEWDDCNVYGVHRRSDGVRLRPSDVEMHSWPPMDRMRPHSLSLLPAPRGETPALRIVQRSTDAALDSGVRRCREGFGSHGSLRGTSGGRHGGRFRARAGDGAAVRVRAPPSGASTSRATRRRRPRQRSPNRAARPAPTVPTSPTPFGARRRRRRGRSRAPVARRQLRGHRPLRPHARDAVRRLAAHHRRQSHRHVPRVPGRDPAPARRRRRDRQHRVERGLKAQPYSAAYCASKAGVVHLTKAIADEYLKRRIRANFVAPGGIETPLQQEFMDMPEGVDWKAFRKVMSPLGNCTPDEIAERRAVPRPPTRRRYMTGSVVSVDGGITSDRELEAVRDVRRRDVGVGADRAAGRGVARSRDALRRRSRDDVRGVPRTWSSARRRACTGSASAPSQRLVAAPDVDRIGRARRRAVPARRGAEPDAADLPVPGGVVHRAADRLQAAHHAVDVEQLRLRRARRAGRGRERRHAHARRRSLEPGGRSRDAAAGRAGRRSGRRSGALDLLHVGHDRGPEGRAAHRSVGDGRRDRLREEDARRRGRHRARRVPVHARRRHHHRRLHAAAHRLGRGAHGGVDTAGVHRADRASTASRSETAPPRSTPRCSPKRRRTPRRTGRSATFPCGGSTKPPQLHDELMEAVPSVGRHHLRLRHDRGADRLADRHRRARRVEARR